MRKLFLILLLFPFTATAQEQDTVEMLFELDREFMEYRIKHGTYKAFAKYLAPNATTLPPGAQPKRGLDAVLADASDKPNTTVTWEPEEGDISGDLGYTWGLFSINTHNDAGAITAKQHGKYTTVWKRQPDGKWLAVVESFSLNPPPFE